MGGLFSKFWNKNGHRNGNESDSTRSHGHRLEIEASPKNRSFSKSGTLEPKNLSRPTNSSDSKESIIVLSEEPNRHYVTYPKETNQPIQSPKLFTTTFETTIAAVQEAAELVTVNDADHDDIISVDTDIVDHDDLDHEHQVQDAVIKIQAGVRGYLARKQLKSNKSSSDLVNCDESSVTNVGPLITPPSFFADAMSNKVSNVQETFAAKTKEIIEVKTNHIERDLNAVKTTIKETITETGQEVRHTVEEVTGTLDEIMAKFPEEFTETQEKEAAVRIQAAFRGYATRKNLGIEGSSGRGTPSPELISMAKDSNYAERVACIKNDINKSLFNTSSNSPVPEIIELQDDDLQSDLNEADRMAATKIQAAYRGYQVRKTISRETSPRPDSRQRFDFEQSGHELLGPDNRVDVDEAQNEVVSVLNQLENDLVQELADSVYDDDLIGLSTGDDKYAIGSRSPTNHHEFDSALAASQSDCLINTVGSLVHESIGSALSVIKQELDASKAKADRIELSCDLMSETIEPEQFSLLLESDLDEFEDGDTVEPMFEPVNISDIVRRNKVPEKLTAQQISLPETLDPPTEQVEDVRTPTAIYSRSQSVPEIAHNVIEKIEERGVQAIAEVAFSAHNTVAESLDELRSEFPSQAERLSPVMVKSTSDIVKSVRFSLEEDLSDFEPRLKQVRDKSVERVQEQIREIHADLPKAAEDVVASISEVLKEVHRQGSADDKLMLGQDERTILEDIVKTQFVSEPDVRVTHVELEKDFEPIMTPPHKSPEPTGKVALEVVQLPESLEIEGLTLDDEEDEDIKLTEQIAESLKLESILAEFEQSTPAIKSEPAIEPPPLAGTLVPTVSSTTTVEVLSLPESLEIEGLSLDDEDGIETSLVDTSKCPDTEKIAVQVAPVSTPAPLALNVSVGIPESLDIDELTLDDDEDEVKSVETANIKERISPEIAPHKPPEVTPKSPPDASSAGLPLPLKLTTCPPTLSTDQKVAISSFTTAASGAKGPKSPEVGKELKSILKCELKMAESVQGDQLPDDVQQPEGSVAVADQSSEMTASRSSIASSSSRKGSDANSLEDGEELEPELGLPPGCVRGRSPNPFGKKKRRGKKKKAATEPSK